VKKVFYNKLIRDKIPQVIKAAGQRCEVRVMEEAEFVKTLKEKLIEEAEELQAVEKEDLVEEMADVLEILYSLAEHHNFDFKLIEEKRIEKKKARGGFTKRLFLVWTTS
jgi:predicted house-cleaning noncanonical NTP pyrophosphatase (MazG superfamily)